MIQQGWLYYIFVSSLFVPPLNLTLTKKIIKLLLEDNQLSAIKLADRIGIASRNIESNIKKLKELGILIRHGSPKNGYWEVTLTY